MKHDYRMNWMLPAQPLGPAIKRPGKQVLTPDFTKGDWRVITDEPDDIDAALNNARGDIDAGHHGLKIGDRVFTKIGYACCREPICLIVRGFMSIGIYADRADGALNDGAYAYDSLELA